MKQILTLVVGLSATAGLACEMDGASQAMLSEDDNAPALFMQMDPPPVSQPFSVDVVLCDFHADAIEIDAWMPAHQHGMNYAPSVEPSENGYIASDFVFQMPGTWQFKAVVVKGDEQFKYTLDTIAK